MQVSLMECLSSAAILAVCKHLHHIPRTLPGRVHPSNISSCCCDYTLQVQITGVT